MCIYKCVSHPSLSVHTVSEPTISEHRRNPINCFFRLFYLFSFFFIRHYQTKSEEVMRDKQLNVVFWHLVSKLISKLLLLAYIQDYSQTTARATVQSSNSD